VLQVVGSTAQEIMQLHRNACLFGVYVGQTCGVSTDDGKINKSKLSARIDTFLMYCRRGLRTDAKRVRQMNDASGSPLGRLCVCMHARKHDFR
jgi:hypothetical protein